MSQTKWYSPCLRRELVTQLYFRAKAEGIAMTTLTNRLVEEGLSHSGVQQFTARVAEDTEAITLE